MINFLLRKLQTRNNQMKIQYLCLNLLLATSSIFASDFLTIEEQNKIINAGISNKKYVAREKLQTVKNAPEFSGKIFPGASLELTPQQQKKQRLALKSFGSNLPNSVPIMTEEKLNHMKEQASKIMFHQINNTLNFLLTSREVIHKALLKNPNLLQLSSNDLTLNLSGPQKIILFNVEPQPNVVEFVQHSGILVTFQYWIDIITLFKQTVFPQNSISSYNHNLAVMIKNNLLPEQIKLLEDKMNSREMLPEPTEISDDEVSLFFNTQRNFYSALLDCFQKIDNAFPSITSIIVPILNNERSAMDIIKEEKRERDTKQQELSDNIYLLKEYFFVSFPYLLRALFIKNVEEIFEFVEGLNYIPSDDPMGGVAREITYDAYLEGFLNSTKNLQELRHKIGLPTEIFNGFDLKQNMKKALLLYTKSLSAAQNKIEVEMQGISISIKEKEKEKEKEEKEVEEEVTSLGTTKQDITMMEKQHIGISIKEEKEEEEKEKEEEIEEEMINFDAAYFKRINQYYQDQKKRSINKNTPSQTLSDYEKELYVWLMQTIYHKKGKITWDGLVSQLSQLGFTGKANTYGNGSTWTFSVNGRNHLFFNNPYYQEATFNVHKLKGNGPIHPAYIKFFKTGFSNVFGLTEEHLLKTLTENSPSLD